MAAQASPTNAGDDVLASQYNNILIDVVDPILGHPHDGSASGGKILGLAALLPEVTDQLGQTIGLVARVSLTTGSTTFLNFVNISTAGRLLGVVADAVGGASAPRIRIVLDGLTSDPPHSASGQEIIMVPAAHDNAQSFDKQEVPVGTLVSSLRELDTFFNTSLVIDVAVTTSTTTFFAHFERE